MTVYTKSQAWKAYDENVFTEFTTIEAVYAKIKSVAEVGHSYIELFFDSISERDNVLAELTENGYNVRIENEGRSLLIRWM